MQNAPRREARRRDIENLERLSMSPSEAWLSYCLLSEVLKRPLFLPVRSPAPLLVINQPSVYSCYPAMSRNR